MKHLWEVDHPYYCSLGNYFANDCGETYECWKDFESAEGDCDPDFNLLFRFDWHDSSDPDHEIEQDELQLFWMGQRKGLYRFTIVKVRKEDEAEIKSWLRTRYKHLKTLWEPL